MRFTRTGQFMIGVADNPDLAALYGINKRQIFLVTMLIAGALAGLGMFLYGTRAQVLPQTGVNLMLFAVAATIMGGIGNVAGAAIAAVILGIIQNASILVIPSEWQGFLLYVFLFLAIVFFPEWFVACRGGEAEFGSATRDIPPGRRLRLPQVRRRSHGVSLQRHHPRRPLRHPGDELQPDHRIRRARLDRASGVLCARRLHVSHPVARFRRAGAAGDAGGLLGRSRCVDRTRAAVASCLRRLPADRQYRLPARPAGGDQERPLHRRTGRLHQHPAVPDPRVRAGELRPSGARRHAGGDPAGLVDQPQRLRPRHERYARRRARVLIDRAAMRCG